MDSMESYVNRVLIPITKDKIVTYGNLTTSLEAFSC